VFTVITLLQIVPLQTPTQHKVAFLKPQAY